MSRPCFILLSLVSFICFYHRAETKVVKDIDVLNGQVGRLKQELLSDVTHINREVADLREKVASHDGSPLGQDEQLINWMRTAVHELRSEMTNVMTDNGKTDLHKEIRNMQNQLNRLRAELAQSAHAARTQEVRLDKLERESSRLKYENQQLRRSVADFRGLVGKLEKEFKERYMENITAEISNEVGPEHPHRHQHGSFKMVHAQISRIAHTQNQLENLQQSLQSQILDVERRIDRYEEPNWNLMSAKLEFLEIENQNIRNNLKNATDKMSDLDKVHTAILELREDVENIENKADKNYPEIRKEVSKLDVNYAQMNAQVSYLKEDQENLRQSVKAIAVSVSNVIERTDEDRLSLAHINATVAHLGEHSKKHFTALNDHILKSEANEVEVSSNVTEISLPQLMGAVKELVPVEREYEDLVNQLPQDCSSVTGAPGAYLIHPRSSSAPVEAWCDHGATIVQRRLNGSVEFNRKYHDYVQGFGPASGENWLGLAAIHAISDDNCTSMRLDMTDIYGAAWYAEYERFNVGPADSGFTLTVSGFHGNASDAFDYQNGMEFSAIDVDRDISNTHCASNYEGGWWYSHCQHVNINGKYSLGLTWFDSIRNEWIAVATSEMRLFRRKRCT